MSADRTDFLIEGTHPASVFPTKHEEVLRTVRLSKIFRVHGGVFARDIVVDGFGTVEGPAYAQREVTLDLRAQQPGDVIKFCSGLGAGGTIRIETAHLTRDSAVHRSHQFSPLVVVGDVFAQQVHLSNARVVGNVQGDLVRVENSVIVGNILAKNEAHIRDSHCVSFDASRVLLEGCNTLWMPYGTARRAIEFADDGQAGPAKLRYLPLCRTEHGCQEVHAYKIQCEEFTELRCPYAGILLTQDDVRDQELDGNTVKIVTIADRILNLGKIEEQVRRVENFVDVVLMFEHLDPPSQERVLRQNLEPQERQMLLGIREPSTRFTNEESRPTAE